jgi:hypothetical protein
MGCLCITIATSSQDILGKIIMNQSQLINLCQKELDRMIDRMHDLCAEGRVDDAKSLYDEIKDWICLGGEIDVMSLNYINGIL